MGGGLGIHYYLGPVLSGFSVQKALEILHIDPRLIYSVIHTMLFQMFPAMYTTVSPGFPG